MAVSIPAALNLRFMAFSRAEASSPGLPSRQEGYSRNSAGDDAQEAVQRGFRDLIHARLRCTAQPRSAILGLRIIPSTIAPCA